MRPGWLPIALLAGLAGLLAAGLPANAAAPQAASWSPSTVEGAPVGVGFLGEGFIAYGTTDAGGIGQDTNVACSLDDGDADLFLFTYPNGTGCRQALDASGSQLGREGLSALATAENAGRVVTGLAPANVPQASEIDMVAWDLESGNLTQAFTRNLGGTALVLATDANGQRTVAGVQAGSDPATADHRMDVLSADGSREARFSLRGAALAVDLSTDARYVAIGGNYTDGNATFGWAHLYDLSVPGNENPVVAREFQRARGGIVTDVTVTDGGRLYTAHLDGQVTAVRADAPDRSRDLGNDTAHVDASPDGRVVAATSGTQLARLTDTPEALETTWTTPVNGTSSGVIVRAPYVYALATGQVDAFDADGRGLWTTTGGTVVATNQTGLGIAAGRPATTSTTGVETSTLSASEVQRSATITTPTSVPTISPGGVAIVNATISNDGAAILNASLDADTGADLSVETTPQRVILRPGQTRTVQAAITVDRDAAPGEHDIRLALSSRPAVNTTGNVTVNVGTETNIAVTLEPGTLEDRAVARDQRLSVRFILSNTGNADADVALSVQQAVSDGDAWPATLTPSGTITIPEGTRTTVRLDLQVPADAADGTTNQVVFQVQTQEGSTASTLSLTVNPFQALGLAPQSITKQMAPGDTASYVFDLENLGSVPANVSVSAHALDANGSAYVPSAWGVVLDRSRIDLGPSSSTSVSLEITAPPNGTTGESLRIQVLATSTDGARASSLAYGVVDEALAEPEDTNDQPVPAWAPIIALLVGAVSLRRWTHGKV